MATFERCDASVNDLANEILCEYPPHKSLLDARVKIDYVFARAKINDNGEKTGDALRLHGVKALGIARKVKLKDRALGRGDAEIALDGDWWKEAPAKERKALLDHELNHLTVKLDVRGFVRDDLGRPVITMRFHDFEFGWFTIIAHRHGIASQERKQAQTILDGAGQYFWPTLCAE